MIKFGKCISDEELRDELDNLTQDEAAELAETIEAERKLARAELTQERCPNCGRFIEKDPQGFFDVLDREYDMSAIAAFCDEPCADQYHLKLKEET